MKKMILVVGLFFIIIACDDSNSGTRLVNKPVTENIPSINKLIRDGTPYNPPAIISLSADDIVANDVVGKADPVTYNGLVRLYDTVWYQTEREIDDGVLEIETEFIFFDINSNIIEREVENGIIEDLEDDDYGTIEFISDITYTSIYRPDGTDMNVFVALNRSVSDIDYEAYWLRDNGNLYVVDGDSQYEVEIEMMSIINNPNSFQSLEDHYLLSVDPIVEVR